MKKATKWIAVVLAVLMMSVVLAACAPEAAEPLTVSGTYKLLIGDTLQLTAGEGVTYETSAASVATVSTAGLVTAVAKGDATITVKKGELSQTISVKVEEDPHTRHYYVDGVCVICKAVDPTYVAPAKVWLDFTADDLDAMEGIAANQFALAMDEDWNFGWHLATLQATARKVAGLDPAPLGGNIPVPNAIQWKTTKETESSFAYFENGGWGVGMRTKGAGNKVYMYNKVNLPENLTQFRVWLGTKVANEHYTNQCMFKVTLLYKENGAYTSKVLALNDGVLPANSENITYTDSGYVKIVNNTVDNAVDCGEGDAVADGMFVYNMTDSGISGDVIVVFELCGIGDKLGTEETESIGGCPEGEAMQEIVVVKRFLFLQ